MSEQEIRDKALAYVAEKFHGDWEYCFTFYDADCDGELTLRQVTQFFIDAGATGPGFMATLIGRRVMSAADQNKNGRLSLAELKRAIEGEE